MVFKTVYNTLYLYTCYHYEFFISWNIQGGLHIIKSEKYTNTNTKGNRTTHSNAMSGDECYIGHKEVLMNGVHFIYRAT